MSTGKLAPYRAEAERVRTAFSASNGCTADTVVALQLLLGFDDGDKENVKPSQKSLKKVPNPSHPRTKTINERKPSKTKPKSSSGCLSIKEQQNLSTELVNKTLKILTEAARSHESSGLRTPGVAAKTKTQISSTTQNRLTSVAACARIAFATLRRIRETSQGKPGSQLELGMLALVGKLLSLGLFTHAQKELLILKQLLEGTKTAKTFTQSKATARIEDMPRLSLPNLDLSTLRLAAQYQTLVLRLCLLNGSDLDEDFLATSLDPGTARGPFWILGQLQSAGANQSEVARFMETLAQQLKSLAHKSSNGQGVSAHLAFKLETYALLVRYQWWSIAQHKVDVKREVIAPIQVALKSLRSKSTANVSKQYQLVHDHLSGFISWDLLKGLQGDDQRQLHELLTQISEVADSADRSTEARQWLPVMDAAASSDSGLSSLKGVLHDMKSAVSPSEQLLLKLQNCLQSCLEPLDQSPDTQIIINSARKLLVGDLVNKSMTSPHIQVKACKCLFECLRLLQGCLNTSISHTSLLESGLIAGGIWLRNVSRESTEIRDLVAAQDQLANLASDMQGDSSKKLLRAFSDLQWHTYRLCEQEEIQKSLQNYAALPKTKLLLGSVNSLSILSAAEKSAANYMIKVNELARCQIEARLYQEAHRSLNAAVEHLSKDGVLLSLTSALDSTPITQLLDQSEIKSAFLDTIDLMTRLGSESKQPQLQSLLAKLSEPESSTIHIAWLICMQERDSDHQQQDLNGCISFLLGYFKPLKFPLRRLQICQRVLALSTSFADRIDDSLVKEAADCMSSTVSLENDVGLARYATHLQKLQQFLLAVYKMDNAVEPFADALRYWNDLGVEAMREAIDNGGFLYALLLKSCPLFEINGHLSLAETALNITQRLYVVDKLICQSQVFVQIAKCRLAMRRGDLSEAELCITKFLGSKPDGRLDARLNIAELRLLLCIFSPDIDAFKSSLTAALELTATSGMKRRDKLKVFLFQADIGLLLACRLSRAGQNTASAEVARAALLLFRSVVASEARGKDKNADQSVKTCTTNNVSDLAEALSNLDITRRDQEASSNAGATDGIINPQIARSIFDCLLLLSKSASSQGNEGEARYFLHQAERAIGRLNGLDMLRRLRIESLELEMLSRPHEVTQNGSLRDEWSEVEAGGIDLTASALNIALGNWHAKITEVPMALSHYALAEKYLALGSQPSSSHEATKNVVSAQTKTSKKKQPILPQSRSVKSTQRSVKSVARSVTKTGTTKRAGEVCAEPSIEESKERMKALVLLRNNDLSRAKEFLDRQLLSKPSESDQRQAIACARLGLAQATADLLADVHYSTLSESTLAAPSTYADPMLRVGGDMLLDSDSPLPKTKQGTKTKASKALPLHGLLSETRSRLSQWTNHVEKQPLSHIYELSSISLSNEMLYSAVETRKLGDILPSRLAHVLEIPANEAFRRQVIDVQADKKKVSLVDLLHDASDAGAPQSMSSWSEFQKELVQILPDEWAVVSLSMNEEGTEIWAARYDRDETPLVLRLPMTRSRDADMDESTTFTYDLARTELRDIIKCSDFSCHNPPDATVKGGKSKWWEEREALDARMRDLLVNIESIWFGGFKSFLAGRNAQPETLARFQKSFEAILDRHLPSRQSAKGRGDKVRLHSQVLALFVRLDVENDGDLEENVLDLLFFVVDILRWNGEANAYDEIDLDEMAVETIDAMKAYHHAAGQSQKASHHLILRLDKRLHGFPWESLPCLHGRSISRVASLLQLRERILTMRRTPTMGRYSVPAAGGAYILNPSGDLGRTQETLSPVLTPLSSGQNWSRMVQTKPDEKAFTTALSTASTLLYFGHGSGTQYVRERAIQRLDVCAPVVWLMGCSSGQANEHGQLETTSVPLSYMAAGLCMAVVATLWDVTDRDIDKFSLAVGQKWGLFQKTKTVEVDNVGPETDGRSVSLAEAVATSRDVCYLRYLNGAASVVYGVPVYLEK
ncbi:hypothetical protein ANO11243_038720 [Dothideomycetidae sp. 11243]|nr:hypothetical protein ANO11243_038720 [fungal sp. No.11243]